MPGKFLEIDVDARELLAAFDRLGDRAEVVCQRAARETGEHVKDEARARLERATGGQSTGGTARAITVQDAPPPLGGVWVFVEDQPGRPSSIDEWNEFGTKKWTGHPFLFDSARLEETNHRLLLAEALQEAIDAEGLGS